MQFVFQFCLLPRRQRASDSRNRTCRADSAFLCFLDRADTGERRTLILVSAPLCSGSWNRNTLAPRGALVADHAPDEADQDRSESSTSCPVGDVPVGRGGRATRFAPNDFCGVSIVWGCRRLRTHRDGPRIHTAAQRQTSQPRRHCARSSQIWGILALTSTGKPPDSRNSAAENLCSRAAVWIRWLSNRLGWSLTQVNWEMSVFAGCSEN